MGGGVTEIELAGALAKMRKFVLPKDYPELDWNEMRILLVDGGERLLNAFSGKSSSRGRVQPGTEDGGYIRIGGYRLDGGGELPERSPASCAAFHTAGKFVGEEFTTHDQGETLASF